jgi:hypothetical protein
MKLAGLVIWALVARAQTTVAEPRVISPNGHRATGKIVVTAVAAFTAADGSRVEQFPAEVKVINGAFQVTLEPNVAGTAYQVHWQLDNARPRTEFWVVPASGTVGVCAVLATPVGASWVVAGCGAGGTGGAKTWSQAVGTWANAVGTWAVQ